MDEMNLRNVNGKMQRAKIQTGDDRREPKRGRRRRRICSAYHVVVVVSRRGASRLSATAVVGVVSITDDGRTGERTWRRR